jgi:hypothetical protein
MWTGTAWDWVIIGLGYAVGLGFFQVLGGLAAASRAIQDWGRRTSLRRAEKLGLRVTPVRQESPAQPG